MIFFSEFSQYGGVVPLWGSWSQDDSSNLSIAQNLIFSKKCGLRFFLGFFLEQVSFSVFLFKGCFLAYCFFLWQEGCFFGVFQEKKEKCIVLLHFFLVRELFFCVCVSGLVLFQVRLFLFNKLLVLEQVGLVFWVWIWNLVWIDRICGWFCWPQCRCLRQFSVVGIHRMYIVNLSMRWFFVLKLFCLHVLQEWIFFVFMFFMSVPWFQCFSLLDWVEVVLEKSKQHTCWCSIHLLGVWQCCQCFCSCWELLELLITKFLCIWDFLKVVNFLCGGDFFRHLLWKFLWCHFICGCPKLTLKEVLQEVFCWLEFCRSLELIDFCVLTFTFFLMQQPISLLLLQLFVWLVLCTQVWQHFDRLIWKKLLLIVVLLIWVWLFLHSLQQMKLELLDLFLQCRLTELEALLCFSV